VTVNIVPPANSFGDRLNQIDLRAGKILRFQGKQRINLNFEVYNALNSDAVLKESQTYSTYRVPSVVVGGRLYKASFQLDF
jgi:hypothetical protein